MRNAREPNDKLDRVTDKTLAEADQSELLLLLFPLLLVYYYLFIIVHVKLS